ncbi:hypothetical protein [Mesorhizobium sp.]|uniref:hypothetical protein n=1 Tax=Mesorhizobium sp. TaxID=1871066 RepID=UPI000FEA93AE|nr:hypothetical protein [Mesorhizobium sp.]RWQ66671.1 MAG: hypothetical protein EOS86_09690 [Mesorhizobium sp.]
MLSKAYLLTLDPNVRAFTLVGAFMGHFALLEVGINAAIGEVLGIKSVRRAIVGRNMGFDDKIKTLRALVDSLIANREEAKKFDTLAKRARTCGELRNIVAHTPFRSSPTSDGVEFFPVSASSKFAFPDMDWSIDDFLKHIDNIEQVDNDLRSIEIRISIQRIAEALIGSRSAADLEKGTTSPLGGLFGLGAAFLDEKESDDEELPARSP